MKSSTSILWAAFVVLWAGQTAVCQSKGGLEQTLGKQFQKTGQTGQTESGNQGAAEKEAQGSAGKKNSPTTPAGKEAGTSPGNATGKAAAAESNKRPGAPPDGPLGDPADLPGTSVPLDQQIRQLQERIAQLEAAQRTSTRRLDNFETARRLIKDYEQRVQGDAASALYGPGDFRQRQLERVQHAMQQALLALKEYDELLKYGNIKPGGIQEEVALRRLHLLLSRVVLERLRLRLTDRLWQREVEHAPLHIEVRHNPLIVALEYHETQEKSTRVPLAKKGIIKAPENVKRRLKETHKQNQLLATFRVDAPIELLVLAGRRVFIRFAPIRYRPPQIHPEIRRKASLKSESYEFVANLESNDMELSLHQIVELRRAGRLEIDMSHSFPFQSLRLWKLTGATAKIIELRVSGNDSTRDAAGESADTVDETAAGPTGSDSDPKSPEPESPASSGDHANSTSMGTSPAGTTAKPGTATPAPPASANDTPKTSSSNPGPSEGKPSGPDDSRAADADPTKPPPKKKPDPPGGLSGTLPGSEDNTEANQPADEADDAAGNPPASAGNTEDSGTAGGDDHEPGQDDSTPGNPQPESGSASPPQTDPKQEADPEQERTDPAASDAGGDDSSSSGTHLTATGFGHVTQNVHGIWRAATGRFVWVNHTTADNRIRVAHIADRGNYFLDVRRTGNAEFRGLAFTIPVHRKCRGFWQPAKISVNRRGGSISGAWRGFQVDRETCELTREPDGETFHYRRHVAATFAEIAPGKFLHLIASPATGNQQAQFKASARLFVDLSGTTAARIRVVSDKGTIQPTGRNVFEFHADRSGVYNIRVELLAQDGTLIHTDRLRVDVPSIPGIGK